MSYNNSPAQDEWTWMGGTGTFTYSSPAQGSGPVAAPGVYGVLGSPSAANIPGAREAPVTWTDGVGSLWMLGGQGSFPGDLGYPDDLWVLNPVSNQWAWMNGTAGIPAGGDVLPTYGVLGAASSTNYPGSRSGAASWTDRSGNLWLFGGCAISSGGYEPCYNDLWRLTPAAPAGQPFFALSAAPGFVEIVKGQASAQGASSISMAVTGGFTSAVALSSSGAPSGLSVSFTPASISYPATSAVMFAADTTVPGGSYPITVTGTGGGLTASTVVTLHLTAPVAPVFNPPGGTYASPQSVVITDETPGATIYYTTDETTPTASSNVYTGPINVAATAHLEAIAIASGYADSPVSNATYLIGANSPLGEWTWMGGSQTPGSAGNYSVLGAPNAFATPAARGDAVHWTDPNGNLWMFGGAYNLSNIGEYNDLWQYTPSIGQWGWWGGNSAATDSTCESMYGCGEPGLYGTLGQGSTKNQPGSRAGSASWVDSQGNLWLFGGLGYDANDQFGRLNDLWEYTPSTLQWTWMGGSSLETLDPSGTKGTPGVYGTLGIAASTNMPGSRYDAASWVDQPGHFWMYGGQGEDRTGVDKLLDDLWMYNPSTNLWTWMGGDDLINVLLGYNPGVYGTKGVGAPTNLPGSRSQAATWTDNSGNFWLFGGNGGLNDLWQYSPSTNQWTWMNGVNTPNFAFDPFVGYNTSVPEPAQLGTLGVPADANVPPSGSGFASWKDNSGNLWLLGGTASDITRQNNGFYLGEIDALWVYNPATNQWAWMGGDTASSNCSLIPSILGLLPLCDGQQGDFGQFGVPSSTNTPPAHTAPAVWTDKNGNFWLFGGGVINTVDIPEVQNDLWEYQPSAATLPAAAAPIFSLKPGRYISGGPLFLSNGMATATIHYTTDGSIPTFASPTYSPPLTVSSSETVRAFATAPGYRDSAVISGTYTFVGQTGTPVITPAASTYTTPTTVAISSPSPGANIFYTIDGSTPSVLSAVYTGPFIVDGSLTVKAIARAFDYSVLDEIGLLDLGNFSAVASATYVIGQSPVAPQVSVTPSVSSLTTAQSLSVNVSVAGPGSSSVPTGSIILSGGGYISLPVQLLNGTGSISILPDTLPAGADVLTVTYTPDSNSSPLYTSATGSATVTVSTAVSPSFSLSGADVSIVAGATSGNASIITVNAAGGFSGSVALMAEITAGPTGGTDPPVLSFGATTPVNLVATSVSTATLTIQTTAASEAALQQHATFWQHWYPRTGALALVLLIGCSRKSRRHRWTACLNMTALVLLTAGSLTGCGSNSGSAPPPNPGTTAGTYTVSVTGTSGSITSTCHFILTVR